MASQAIYNLSTNLLRIESESGGPVTNELDGSTITGATAEITTIIDSAGQQVAGVTYPIALSEHATGRYAANIADTLAVVAGQAVTVRAVMTAGALKRTFSLDGVVIDG